ncbi:FAD-binding oxidoreductase [Actinomadura sp. J1-007]|uniref:NAD(P)/FAD-dependent oxidoreductase n=1 Tax=Actinomadura sp. J1-007 TaxID=2661913 RepID=UPI002815FBEC|nr:FAD-binding oxidoreductase [Actinomadura sp. J1-007]
MEPADPRRRGRRARPGERLTHPPRRDVPHDGRSRTGRPSRAEGRSARAEPGPAAGRGRPPTYWLESADPDAFAPPAVLPARADAVVVGAGLMGAATAYWLARLGVDVLVVEARRPAWGTSGRNAGLSLNGLRPVEDGELTLTVLREEGIRAGYERRGHLALASSAEVWERFRAEAARLPAPARLVEALDLAACEELLGRRIDRRFFGGRWFPGGHVIHPVRLVHGLAAAAVRHGAAIASGTRVLGIGASARARFEVLTDRGRIGADHVVFACGLAARELAPPLRDVLTPARGQMLATAPLPPVFGFPLAVDYGSVYWRQVADGTVLLGGCRGLDPDAEASAEERVNPLIHQGLDAFLPRTFPGFPPVTARRRWAGIMDCTPDGRPVVGALPGAPGRWVIAGFGGHGIPPALGSGRALAETVVTGRTPMMLESFAPDRLLREARTTPS